MDIQLVRPGKRGDLHKWSGSCIDIACRPLVINEFWMYDNHLDMERLRRSLAELLDFYAVCAGRINGNDVLCNASGAAFEVADFPDVAIGDISRDRPPHKRFMSSCRSRDMLDGKSPVMAVKLSRLRDGDILNVRCAHLCADGNTFFSMMENWASLSRGEGMVRKPVYDDSVIPGILKDSPLYIDATRCAVEEADEMMMNAGMKAIRPAVMLRMMWQKVSGIDRHNSGPVFIPGARIHSLKETVLKNHGVKVGTNAVLSAIAVDMLREPMGWTGKEISLSHTADHRGRKKGIGESYAGNASFVLRPSVFNADIPAERIAMIVEEDLRTMFLPENEEDYFSIYCAMLESRRPYLPFDVNAMWRPHPTTFIINNCLKFNVYSVDFGAVRPVFVWPLDFNDPVRFWPAPPEMDGVFLYFSGRFAVAEAQSTLDYLCGESIFLIR